MAQLIDSSVFIALERRGLSLGALAAAIPDEPIALSSMTASELLIGVHRADSPERRSRREAFVEAILLAIPVVPFDLRVARTHARLLAELAGVGQPIGAHDLIIAATAVANGLAVLTDNLRHFDRVPGLRVLQPRW
ncbi:MAG TPA: type II toxin-antitoxin system VapC family toxin [Chloroflexota bacterium]|nr:type II toxin-antitoxin system VapC family toxin [Chloroflexota bacterium]